MISWWAELDTPVMQGDLRCARRAPELGLLLAFSGAGALPLDLDAQPTALPAGPQGLEEFDVVGRVAVVLGTHQQVDLGIATLLVEQLVEVGLANGDPQSLMRGIRLKLE